MTTEVTVGSGTTINISWVQGLPGPAGIGTVIYATGDQAIGGHRVVKATATGVDYADSSNSSDQGKVVGITASAFAAGDLVKVYTAGEIIESTWTWTPGPVYLGTNGLLTQTVPTSGFVQQVGVAHEPTKLVVQILSSIKLG